MNDRHQASSQENQTLCPVCRICNFVECVLDWLKSTDSSITLAVCKSECKVQAACLSEEEASMRSQSMQFPMFASFSHYFGVSGDI